MMQTVTKLQLNEMEKKLFEDFDYLTPGKSMLKTSGNDEET